VISVTPEPPYTAVIFTSVRSTDTAGYDQTAAEMFALVETQPGYLGAESAHTTDGVGITVSYWVDEASARAWRSVLEHVAAQHAGIDRFYRAYRVRVATVVREHAWAKPPPDQQLT
jgi:heme-degrading monooxygenase HmoA